MPAFFNTTMATILDMKKRFEQFHQRTDEIIYGAIKDNEQDLNDLNLEQIYSGKTSTGENLRPSYLEDPYWDTHKFRGQTGIRAAIAYSNWKDQITPNPFRNPGIPNLFINGYYHSKRTTLVSPGGEIIHDDSASFGDDIKAKYKNLDGLGGRFKEIFLNEYVRPVLNGGIEEVLKLKVGST
jgi:hypothetical protein